MSAARFRDELVGAAMRELRVPEHGPGFWRGLESTLADEAAPQPRRSAPSGRRGPRRTRWAVAAVAGAVAAAALVIGLPRTETPAPALATIVKERVATAASELRTLAGTGTYRGPNPNRSGEDRFRYRFALSARGDLRLDMLGRVDDLAYDATRGIQRAVNSSASLGGLGVFYSERRGLPPGPPDLGPSEDFLQRQLGSAVRALLASQDPRIEETTYMGRPAWRARLRVRPNVLYADADLFDVTVDAETGLPVSVITRLNGELRTALRINDLRVNEPLAKGAFGLRFPAGAEVSRSDEGFRRVPIERVEARVGYAPLVPEDPPAGFRLAEVAVARRAFPTGAEAGNPVSRGVVSLAYRRGFERFIVSTRLTGPERGAWSDPAAAGEGLPERARERTLSAGAFTGERGFLVVGPRSIPHLWAVSDELVLTVTGDLGPDELVRVAESLAAR